MKNCWDKEWRDFAKNVYFKPNQFVVDEIVKLTNPKGKKILEVGAGSGSDAIMLAKKGAVVTTLDFSSQSTKICRLLAKKEGTKIKAVTADCQKMPFSNNTFDLVFSVGLVEHFQDPIPVIDEQLRVLKPGGYLIVDVPQKFNLYTLVKKYRMANGSFPFGWETEYSYFDLQKIAKKLNVKVIKYFGHDSAFTLHLPQSIQPVFKKIFSIIENSTIAPFVCLDIALVLQKKNKINS